MLTGKIAETDKGKETNALKPSVKIVKDPPPTREIQNIDKAGNLKTVTETVTRATMRPRYTRTMVLRSHSRTWWRKISS